MGSGVATGSTRTRACCWRWSVWSDAPSGASGRRRACGRRCVPGSTRWTSSVVWPRWCRRGVSRWCGTTGCWPRRRRGAGRSCPAPPPARGDPPTRLLSSSCGPLLPRMQQKIPYRTLEVELLRTRVALVRPYPRAAQQPGARSPRPRAARVVRGVRRHRAARGDRGDLRVPRDSRRPRSGPRCRSGVERSVPKARRRERPAMGRDRWSARRRSRVHRSRARGRWRTLVARGVAMERPVVPSRTWTCPHPAIRLRSHRWCILTRAA